MLNHLKKAISDRLESPLLSPYYFFLVILNWKIWLIIFTGEAHYSNRITDVGTLVKNLDFYLNFLYAVAPTLLFIFGIPEITKLVDFFRHKQDLRMLKQKLKFERDLQFEHEVGGKVNELIATMRKDLISYKGLCHVWLQASTSIQTQTPDMNLRAQLLHVHKTTDELVRDTQEFENLSASQIKTNVSMRSGVLFKKYGERFKNLV